MLTHISYDVCGVTAMFSLIPVMQKSSSASLSFIRHKECLSTSASLQLHIFNLLNYTNTYFIYFDSKFLFPSFSRDSLSPFLFDVAKVRRIFRLEKLFCQ
jgi:hypothetical protein